MLDIVITGLDRYNFYNFFKARVMESFFCPNFLTMNSELTYSTCLVHVMNALLPEAAERSNTTASPYQNNWSDGVFWEMEST